MSLKPLLAVALVLLAALVSHPSRAEAAARRPAIVSLEVVPQGPAQRALKVTTAGPALRLVEVCDLEAAVCVRARHRTPHTWRAVLPAADSSSPYALGVIGLARGRYVFRGFATDPSPTFPGTG